MTPNSELGPIDPLIRWLNPKTGKDEWRSASSFIRAWKEYRERVIDKGEPVTAYIPLIGDLDYPFIMDCRDAIERAKEIERRRI